MMWDKLILTKTKHENAPTVSVLHLLTYRKVSNTKRTKSQNLIVSRLIL